MLKTPIPPARTRSSSGAAILKVLRKLHLYFGLFIAPALMFFAFTGAMQTLSLHEAAGADYKPPAWLASLAQLHKDQNVVPRKPRPPQSGPPHPGPPTPEAAQATAKPPAAHAERPLAELSRKEHEHLPEKLFFLVVSLGLFSSTLTGIYMAYKFDRNKWLVTGLLIAGIAVPLVLLPF